MDRVYLPFYKRFMIKDRGARALHTGHALPVHAGSTADTCPAVFVQASMTHKWTASLAFGTLMPSCPAMATLCRAMGKPC
jgi:hypothetical protein